MMETRDPGLVQRERLAQAIARSNCLANHPDCQHQWLALQAQVERLQEANYPWSILSWFRKKAEADSLTPVS